MSTIRLTWTASTDDTAVTAYMVERLAGSSFVQIGTTGGLTYDDVGLAEGTAYSYRVRAGDAALNLSAYSATATATTLTTSDTTPPTAPTGLAATALGQNQIHLVWTASTDNIAVTGYLIERHDSTSLTFVQIGTAAGISFDDSGLTAGTLYTYRIRATDAALNLSAYSSTASATTSAIAPPPQPPSLLVDDDFNRADGGLGTNWITPLSSIIDASGTFRIVSNKAAAVTNNQHSYAIYSAASFNPNQSSQITIETIGAWVGVCLRAEQNVNRFYLVFVFGANDYRIYNYWNTQYNSMSFGTAVTWTVGDVMRAEVSGGLTGNFTTDPVQIRMFRNNVMVLANVVSPTWSKILGNPGLGIYNPTGFNLRDDNWEGANLDATYFGVVDNFNRADGAIGANWTSAFFTDSTLVVASNKCGVTAENSFCNAFWSADSFTDNQYAQFTWSDVVGGNVSFTGVLLRADAAVEHCYMCLVTDRNLFSIYARWAGTNNLLTSIVLPSNCANGDVIRAEITGTTHPFSIAMYRNGIYMGMWLSSDNTYSRSGGSPGISIFSNTGNHLVIDNWAAGDLP